MKKLAKYIQTPVLVALLLLIIAVVYASVTKPAVDKPADTDFLSTLYEENKPPTGDDISDPQTFTQKYLSGLSADASREDILDKERLEVFIRLNKGELLPDVPEESINTVASDNQNKKEIVSEYVNAISATRNKNLYLIDHHMIDEAFADQLDLYPETMLQIVDRLEHNITVLQAIAVPPDLADLHIKITAANRSLLENTKRLRDIDDDFIGGLIGSRNISDLGHVFAEIAGEVKDLQN